MRFPNRPGFAALLENPMENLEFLMNFLPNFSSLHGAAIELTRSNRFETPITMREISDFFISMRNQGADIQPASAYTSSSSPSRFSEFKPAINPQTWKTSDMGIVEAIDDLVKKKPDGVTLIDIANYISRSPVETERLISLGRSTGMSWGTIADGVIYLHGADAAPMGHARVIKIDPVENEFKVGVASDLHYGSKACMKEEIVDCVNHFYSNGVRIVLIPGDLIDNNCVYSGQADELEVWHVDKQIDILIKSLPEREGLVYYYITGNHDLASRKKVGSDIARIIKGERPDMVYLGPEKQKVKLPDKNGIDIELRHAGSMAYAMSHPIQKMVERGMRGGSKPHVLINGHLHYGAYIPLLRNVHSFVAGCFQGETRLTIKHSIPVAVGGWMLTFGVDKKKWVKTVVPQWIGYYLGIREITSTGPIPMAHKMIQGWEKD